MKPRATKAFRIPAAAMVFMVISFGSSVHPIAVGTVFSGRHGRR
jgi:hypothetical protein